MIRGALDAAGITQPRHEQRTRTVTAACPRFVGRVLNGAYLGPAAALIARGHQSNISSLADVNVLLADGVDRAGRVDTHGRVTHELSGDVLDRDVLAPGQAAIFRDAESTGALRA